MTGGTLDPAFGTGGRVYVGDATNPMRGYSLQLQADGKLVIGGEKSTGNGTDDFLLLRLTAAGVPDTSFNPVNGYITTDFFNEQDNVHSVTIQPDGRILAYGVTIQNATMQEEQPVIARYIAGPASPPVAVGSIAARNGDIRVYPAPVSGNSLQVAAATGHDYQGYLYTHTGGLVQTARIAAGKGAITLPGTLADGLYFLVLQDEQDRSVSRHQVVIRRD